MPTTQKSRSSGWANSWWILWTFTGGLFNWVAFAYIGVRARQSRWILFAYLYAIIPIIMLLSTDWGSLGSGSGWLHWIGSVWFPWAVITSIFSIPHAASLRSQYVSRLRLRQAGMISPQSAVGRAPAADRARKTSPASTSRSTQSPKAVAAEPARTPGQSQVQAQHPVANPHVTTAPQPSATSPSRVTSLVDLNSAPVEQIAALPGVGTALAQRALLLRDSQNGFKSVEEFGAALGLGPAVVETLRPLVTVNPLVPTQPV